MEFNLLLVIFLLVVAAEAYSGVKKGMVKKLVSLIALVVMIVMTALIVYGLGSYRNGHVFGVLGCIIVLSIIAAVYFVVKLV
ncbi:MAG: hypothetical protein K6F84_04215, partial [Lachnospiraceae bacterium]|nr:hypothetical protein [Lachnospiraceae bacterium]